jgi:hypothetical protein
VHSSLSNGAKEILYLSAPSLISTSIPLQLLGPINQYLIKSTDRGNTWTTAKGMPSLRPLLAGGNCETLDLLGSYGDQELIIWGDGFARSNGTVMYGLHRCRALSIAISDSEGDSWRYIDVPGSSLPPVVLGDLTYLLNGNVLVPEPISQDIAGNIYTIWVDENYVLKMSRSTDSTVTWSSPLSSVPQETGQIPTLWHTSPLLPSTLTSSIAQSLPITDPLMEARPTRPTSLRLPT